MTAPDVAVVGAGIVGMAAAATLAGAGARVAVLEASAIGAGASGRNSGVIQHPFDPALRPLYLDSLALYRALAEEPELGLALPVEPAGLLLVALHPDGPRRLAADLAAAWPELDPRFIAAGQLQRLEPRLAPNVSACRVRIGYPVPPAAATQAFAGLARRRGGEFRIGLTATGLAMDGHRVVGVRLADGRVQPAGAVLVAAGPSSPGVVDPGGSWRPIRPFWGVVVEVGLKDPPGYVIEEAEMDDALGQVAVAATVGGGGGDQGLPARAAGLGPEADDADDGPDASGDRPKFSLVTAAGKSSLGSTFLEREPDPAGWVPRLVARGRRFVPAIGSAARGTVRVCARPLSVDGRPLLGPVPGIDGAFIASGHGPWGISTGPGSARLVADLILGRPAAIPAELDAGRFGVPPRR